MIAEIIGLIAFLSICIFFIWRISVRNRTLFESPVFRTFVPIFILSVMAGYIIVVLLQWNPVRSLTGITSLALLAAFGAYLQMPVSSEHFLAHLKIVGYNIAPKGAWIEIILNDHKIIGEVVALRTTAVTLKDEEGTLHIIENQSFLNGNPRRLDITVDASGSLTNVYMYRVDVALPFSTTTDWMGIKKNIAKGIIKTQLSQYSTDGVTVDGEAIDSDVMTGFVFDKTTGTHVAPRIYFNIVASLSGIPYVQFVILIPCENYWEGFCKWHSYIGKLTLQCYNELKG